MKTSMALAIFAVSGSAIANLPPVMRLPAYEEVDSNLDGTIDAAEAEIVGWLDFRAADIDQDGVLSRPEYAKAISSGIRI